MAASQPSYRTSWLLAGFVLLGWLLDFALGGGIEHSAAWFAALVLVGGISALSTRAARSAAAETAATQQAAAGQTSPTSTGAVQTGTEQTGTEQTGTEQTGTEQTGTGQAGTGQAATAQTELTGPNSAIRPAVPADFDRLIEIEEAADKLFVVSGYGSTPGPATPAELGAAPLLLLAGEPPVGYVRVEVLDGQAHLEGLSVRPKFMRRGIGSALVTAALDWAGEQGFERITLCTFADVPWNAPFYATLGFVELAELTPELQAVRAAELALGLDAMGRRIVLCRQLPIAGQR